MKTFQIKQNYGQGCGGYIYFESDSEDISELKKISLKEMEKDWGNVNPSLYLFSPPKPAAPTIHVFEYDNEIHKKVKNGISFKTKWR